MIKRTLFKDENEVVWSISVFSFPKLNTGPKFRFFKILDQAGPLPKKQSTKLCQFGWAWSILFVQLISCTPLAI